MKETLLFLLLGLGTGATIAAIALGVVVTYRGSGFINLAAGAIAMLAGFSFWALRTGELGFTVATPLAIAGTYLFVSVVSIAIEFAVYRPLRTAPPLAKLVASLGVLLTAQATMPGNSAWAREIRGRRKDEVVEVMVLQAVGRRWPRNCSRSADLSIFPVLPRGMSSTKTTSSGVHHLATLPS